MVAGCGGMTGSRMDVTESLVGAGMLLRAGDLVGDGECGAVVRAGLVQAADG